MTNAHTQDESELGAHLIGQPVTIWVDRTRTKSNNVFRELYVGTLKGYSEIDDRTVFYLEDMPPIQEYIYGYDSTYRVFRNIKNLVQIDTLGLYQNNHAPTNN